MHSRTATDGICFGNLRLSIPNLMVQRAILNRVGHVITGQMLSHAGGFAIGKLPELILETFPLETFFALGLRWVALYSGAQFALAGSARMILGTGL